jgi:hypothetical protein
MNTFQVALWGDAEPVQVTIHQPLPKVEVNGQEMPEAAVLHLMTFGFRQALRDAGAGLAEKPDEANAAAHKKLSRIMAGEFGGGGGGPKRTPLERVIDEIAAREIRAAAIAKGFSITQGTIDKLVPKHVENARERLEKLAREEMERAAQAPEVELDFAAAAAEAKAEAKAKGKK